MKSPAFLGLDIGTSSVKAVLTGVRGKIIRSARETYKLNRSSSGSVQLPVERMLDAVLRAIGNVISRDESVQAVTATSFGEAFIRLNGHLEPLGDIMMYTDSRGEAQAAQLAKDIEAFEAYRINGCGISTMYSLPKLMWLREEQADAYKQIRHCIPVADFVLWRLGATLHSSYSLAARTMAFDITQSRWSDEVLTAAGIDAELFPDPVPIGTDLGHVNAQIAGITGLPTEARIIAGGHDQVFAAIGAGLKEPGTVTDGMGSVECLTAMVPDDADLAKMHDCFFVRVPYIPESLPVTYAFSLGGGELMSWFSRKIYQHDTESGLSVIDGMIASMADSADGVLVLPHLNGAGTPFMDSSATASISGITATTDRSQMIRGMLNSLNYEMMLNIEKLIDCGFDVSRIIATGGGIQSSRQMQLKADTWNRRIQISAHQDGGALGAAIVAATGVGTLSSIEEGIDAWTSVADEYRPADMDRSSCKTDMDKYRRYYPAIRTIFTTR